MGRIRDFLLPSDMEQYVVIARELFGWSREQVVEWLDCENEQLYAIEFVGTQELELEFTVMLLNSRLVSFRANWRQVSGYTMVDCEDMLSLLIGMGLRRELTWGEVRAEIAKLEEAMRFFIIPLIRDC